MEKMRKILISFTQMMSFLCLCQCLLTKSMPCNESLTKACPSSLYFVPKQPKTLEETASMFNLPSNRVNKTVDGFVIAVDCSCPAGHDEFVWHMYYTVQAGDTWEIVSAKFGSFVMEMHEKQLIPSQPVILDLLCGCSGNFYIATYRVQTGDTVYTICSSFGANVDQMIKLNRLDNPELIHAGDVVFIPVAGPGSLILQSNQDLKAGKVSNHHTRSILGCVIAITAGAVLLFSFLFCIFHNKRKGKGSLEAASAGTKVLCCFPALFPASRRTKQNMAPLVHLHKSTVFSYHEVRDATFNFNISKKIGEGSYGSVYLGRLKGTEVAIKQMKNTKSKEFLAEINILCKVHHTNLIELIGYAAGGDSLFLVYEFAQNGALSDHLHHATSKGYKPLSWTRRIQIALDAAKGLEYIHAHTKPYYVHRDVKTSNILLDSNFRAKIADFGLVKLLEYSPDVETATSKIVGTFGYLAPEYVRDGCVTTKSDVYSFGVVLMELLTGQPALCRASNSVEFRCVEHRSVVDVILSALEDEQDPMNRLTECIDPSIFHYHSDSLFQMALLSKDCVDEHWKRRPDMSRVVFRISHILANTMEWEGKGPISLLC